MHCTTTFLTLLSSIAFTSALPQSGPPSEACPITAQMPECGVPCIQEAAISIGCTKFMDFECQCQNAAAMQAAVMPCVATACGATLAPVVGQVANAICEQCVTKA
ncbi:hypothetical protein B0T20DRAFT_480493 [Sordaria brevicollis]|uniref:CFEM domain-containing protein n=1 Tax=Sordaria brevicollis TaxID=83679 RepID=A0AAE0PBR6_SORBR|nr:hypothetical protein B0T20DRAFT_480493 [Sordaria brevicollis]